MKLPFNSTTKQTLNKITENPNRVYLLYGPTGVGKYLASREIAAQLLNESNIATNNSFGSPNLFILEPEPNKQNISIEQVRTFIDRIWKTSVDGSAKIAIVRGIENISESGANALLKNLEDIAPNTTFLLLSDSISDVLPTIRSRSQLVYFAPIDQQVALAFLKDSYALSGDNAQELLVLAHDKIAHAIDLIDSDTQQIKQATQNQSQKFLTSSTTQRFVIAKGVAESSSTQEFLSELIYAIKEQSIILNEVDILDNIVRAQEQLRANVSARTVIENLSLK